MSNLNHDPNPKEKVKLRSKVIIAAAVVVLILIGLGAGLLFGWMPFKPFEAEAPKIPTIEVPSVTKTISADQLKEYFGYREADNNLHDFFVKYGENKDFDIPTDEEGIYFFTFPKGLYLDTRSFGIKANEEGSLDFINKHDLPLSINNQEFCQKLGEEFVIKNGKGEVLYQTGALKPPKLTLAFGSDSYPNLSDKENQFRYEEVTDKFRLKVFNKKNNEEIEVKDVVWQSSDPRIASVYPDGSIFPFYVGEVSLRAVACQKELGRVIVEVPQTDVNGRDFVKDFNPRPQEFDTRFINGFGLAKKSLISDVPAEKYIKKVQIKPHLDSFYSKWPDILFNKSAAEEIQYVKKPGPGPFVQGTLRFFLSNDNGETWKEGDKIIDNKLLKLEEAPTINFELETIGSDLKTAILFQSDFDQGFYNIDSEEIVYPFASPGDWKGLLPNVYSEGNKMALPVDLGVKGEEVYLPAPGPIITGLDLWGYYEDKPAPPTAVPPPPPPVEEEPTPPATPVAKETPKIAQPTEETPLGLEYTVWHRGHSRVILKFRFTSGAENTTAAQDIEFRYGENKDNLNLGSRVFLDKNDPTYPYVAVIIGLKGGEYHDKNEGCFEAGRCRYYFQVKTQGKASPVVDFQTMNRLQTIAYYYDLLLNRKYTSDLNAFLTPDNEFQGKKVNDLEDGGLGFFYKPKDGEPLTLPGVKFTILNDRRYEEFDIWTRETLEKSGIKEVVKNFYRRIHDRIYVPSEEEYLKGKVEIELGRFYDEAGVDYWVSRTDPKIVGIDVIDILGVKFAMTVSPEFIKTFSAEIDQAQARPELSYWIVLKRGADKPGLEYLLTKYRSSKDMRRRLAESDEYKNRLREIEKTRGREAAVSEIYETLYARAADVEGRKYWFNTKMTLDELMKTFMNSPEFKAVLKEIEF